MKITEKAVPGYERVVFAEDPDSGYRGIIAVHNTTLGPGAGGTRLAISDRPPRATAQRHPMQPVAYDEGLRLFCTRWKAAGSCLRL